MTDISQTFECLTPNPPPPEAPWGGVGQMFLGSNVVAVRRSCRKKGVQTDRHTKGHLYIVGLDVMNYCYDFLNLFLRGFHK